MGQPGGGGESHFHGSKSSISSKGVGDLIHSMPWEIVTTHTSLMDWLNFLRKALVPVVINKKKNIKLNGS